MSISLTQIQEQPPSQQVYTWSDQNALLYAIALGFGREPDDPETLPFVYEEHLKVVPTMPTVLAWIAEPRFETLGVDPITALHGEQAIEIYQPLRLPLTVTVQGRVVSVRDKGAQRGALIVSEHEICGQADGVSLARLTTTCFGRSEGGCGDFGPAPAPPHSLPDRPADRVTELATQPDGAMLYRLTGDRNPLHVDPRTARAAGLPRPILHGLCTFGMGCRAVLRTYAGFDPAVILSQKARFAAPVFPGETLRFELWRDGDVVSFSARVLERDVLVLTNGQCLLASS